MKKVSQGSSKSSTGCLAPRLWFTPDFWSCLETVASPDRHLILLADRCVLPSHRELRPSPDWEQQQHKTCFPKSHRLCSSLPHENSNIVPSRSFYTLNIQERRRAWSNRLKVGGHYSHKHPRTRGPRFHLFREFRLQMAKAI